MEFYPLILAWLLFGVIHSLTASLAVKSWAKQYMGPWFRYYRLLYNGLAVLTFILLLYLHDRFRGQLLWQSFPGQYFLAGVITAFSLVILFQALSSYNLREFSGLDAFQTARKSEQLRQEGPLRYVRHPLYSGTILFVFSLFFNDPTSGNLILLVGTITYIRIGIFFEERKLVSEFGASYRTYQKQVPMLIPRWPARSTKPLKSVP